MNLDAIISSAADEADEFLAGVGSMTEAQPLIREYLKEHHPSLAPVDLQRVMAGVLAILDEEGFFESQSSGGDAWADGDAADDE